MDRYKEAQKIVEYWMSNGSLRRTTETAIYIAEAYKLLDKYGSAEAVINVAPNYGNARYASDVSTAPTSGSPEYFESDVPSRLGSTSSGGAVTNEQWITRMNQQLAAAGMSYISNTDTTVTANSADGVITFPLGADGTINFTNPITAMSAMDQLDLQYRQAQLAKLLGDLGGGGGGGGTGRVQFESESRLQNAQASQIEQELAAIQAGTSRFQPFNGGFYDPQTGEFFDPSDVGLNRYNAETSRFNANTNQFNADTQRRLADFTTGPEFQENIRQFNQDFGLRALGEERLGRTAAAQSEVALGNLGVDRARLITDILKSPSDTLARLYMQRGGTSPLAKIEMADLLNSVNQQGRNVTDSVSRLFAPSGLGANLQQPARPPTPTPVPVPALVPSTPLTGAGSGNPNYLSPLGDPYSPEAQARWAQGIDEGSIKVVTEDPSNYQAIEDNANTMFTPDESGQNFRFEVNDQGSLVAVPIMARGGYTRESRFIVGDQRSGRPTGYEELVVNPTNAPIAVVPNKALSRFAQGSVKRYDRGTIKPKRTGGFWNSLRESLGDLGDVVEDKVGDFNEYRTNNRRITNENLNDPEFKSRLAETGTDMMKGGGSVDDISRMFKRASVGEKMERAAREGLDTSHIPLADKLRVELNKSRQELASLVSGNSPEQFQKMKIAREKVKQLEQMLDEETVAKPNEVRSRMMQEVTDSFKESQELGKQASAVVEQMTGGLYTNVDELLEAANRADDEQYMILRKVTSHPAVRNYILARDNHYERATLLGRATGGEEGIDRIEPGPSRYADGTGTLSSAYSGYNDTHSLFPTGNVTQSQLIDMSRLGTGPGGNSVLSGSMPDRFRIPGLPTPTAMQFNSLSSAEKENLRPRLAAEFNSTLEDLMFDIEQRYSTGPSRMARFRG